MATTTPPLAVPSSLVKHNAGDASRLREQPRLLQSVLAGGGVHHQQRLVRSAGDEALRGAAHLLQLRHQVALGVQSPGGIDDHVVDVSCLGGLQRIEQHRRRIAARLVLDDLNASAISPDFELLDRGRAKRVGRSQQHALALRAQRVSQFAGRSGLAGAVHADDENDLWLAIDPSHRLLAR